MATGPGLTLSIHAKRYPGDDPLFADFHAQIAPGSVTALVGPSGIGKSTLLRLVAGIDRDFEGSILVSGQLASDAPPPGFVFQDPRLLPWLTVFENVRTAGRAISTDAASLALAQTGLSESHDLFPHQLSGGMQRRAALARALALNAELLLLDEPFVSLDRDLVGEMHALMVRVLDEQRPTTLLVTHIADDAIRLADRILVLGGRPARVTGDLALDMPRGKRDAQVLEDYRRRIDVLI